MLIIGEGGSGKTSLLRRLYHPKQALPEENETTKGIDIYRHEFPLKSGQRFRLNVWDFGGQEIYHATHQFFLTKRSLYLLLDDTRKDNKSVSDREFKYWLDLIDLFGGHSPVLLFQNEKGGRSKTIDLAGIKGQFDNVKECYGGNLEHTNAADKLREGIEWFAANLPHIGEALPASWVKVRAAIETRADQTPHITQQEYFDIYAQHLPFDRTKALFLSRYLHDLGVFLHFQDDEASLLDRIVILQNQWATTAVYRMLDDEAVKKRQGQFDRNDCKRLWHDQGYEQMHPELLALMQRFELCYALPHSTPPSWLAPQLLPVAKPAALQNWNQLDDLVLRYRYAFLPKGIISRLMVRLHRFVRDPHASCVNAVLFARENTMLLAELLPSGSEIELRARGPEQKILLSVVADEIDAINDGFDGLRDTVDKLIPCHCPTCSKSLKPFLFEQRDLKRRLEHGQHQAQCSISYQFMEVQTLLDGIHVSQTPAWAQKAPTAPAKPRKIKLFLATSDEMLAERNAFELYFRQQNDELRDDNIYLEIHHRDSLACSVTADGMQAEIKRAIADCDIFLCLSCTKAEASLHEEFDTAHAKFSATSQPQIFTFFKDPHIKASMERRAELQSLWAFEDKLKELGHFPTRYHDIEDLKRQFSDQLRKLLKSQSA